MSRLSLALTKEHRLAVLAALAGLLVTLVASLTDRIFEPSYPVWPTVVVTLPPVGIAIVLSRLRWPLRLAVQIVIGALLVSFVITRNSGSLPSDLVGGITRGGSAVFGTRWPVPAYPRAVALIAVIVVAAAIAACEMAISGKFASGVLLPPVILLAVVSLAAAADGMPPPRFLVLLTLGCLAVLRLASLSRRDLPHHAKGSPEAVERRSVLTMAIVGMTAVSVGVVPALLAGAISNDDRFDPRQQIRDESIAADDISPLSRLDLWTSLEPSPVMFRTSSAQGRRWRVATMSRYDGRSWMPPSDYQLAGTRIEQPASSDEDVETIDVTWGDLDVRWLPAPAAERVLTIDRRVKVDTGLGGFLAGEVPAPSETYRILVQPRPPDPDRLKGSVATRQPSPFIDGFELPPSVVDLAASIVEGRESDYDRALAIADFLREKYTFDSQAPAGHSLGVLTLFLETSKSGRDEQFVAAYGLLASAVGLPVRIAVGFTATPDNSGGTVALASDAMAWPEVEFAGSGWVAMNAVPEQKTSETGSGQRAVNPAPVEENRVPPTTQAPPPTTARDEPRGSLASGAEGVIPNAAVKFIAGSLFILLALAAYVVVVLRLKSGRRRKRAVAGSPEARTTGAFRSSMDTLIDLGGRAPAAKTDRELAIGGRQVLLRETESLGQLAVLSTQAVYDGPEPGDDLGDTAWERQEAFEAEARAATTRWRWWRARLSMRSLRRGLPD